MIHTRPNQSSWSPTASPVFPRTLQPEAGMEIVLEDTKDAAGASWVIVFMADNTMIIMGLTGLLLGVF